MPGTYSPDGWVVVEIKGTDPHFRVFGSFDGGFAKGDSWKINSGITGCTYNEETQTYTFKGYSGSIYHCHKDGYGRLSLYNQSVIDNFIKKSDNLMEALNDVEDWTKKDWII